MTDVLFTLLFQEGKRGKEKGNEGGRKKFQANKGTALGQSSLQDCFHQNDHYHHVPKEKRMYGM